MATPTPDTIEIPVTMGNNPECVIGQLTIDTVQLPPHTNWTLAPTMTVTGNRMAFDTQTGQRITAVTDYELQGVNLIPNRRQGGQ